MRGGTVRRIKLKIKPALHFGMWPPFCVQGTADNRLWIHNPDGALHAGNGPHQGTEAQFTELSVQYDLWPASCE